MYDLATEDRPVRQVMQYFGTYIRVEAVDGQLRVVGVESDQKSEWDPDDISPKTFEDEVESFVRETLNT